MTGDRTEKNNKILPAYPLAILLILFLFAPLRAPAVDAADIPSSPAQNVEEPDAPDDGTQGMPPQEETPPVPVPVPAKAEEKPPGQANVEGDSGYDTVTLQGLNKVTARAQTLMAPIGSTVRFGAIEIVAHKCWKSAPEESPENAALLEISEIKQGEAPQRIFMGWMFSSSPGLSSLENPFYDVTVVKCGKEEAAPAAPEKPAKGKKALKQAPK